MQTPATEIDQMIVQLNEFILPSSLMEKGTRRQSFAFVPPKWWPPGNTGCDCGRENITIEAFDWRVGAEAGQRGDWLIEFRRKSRILRAFDPK